MSTYYKIIISNKGVRIAIIKKIKLVSLDNQKIFFDSHFDSLSVDPGGGAEYKIDDPIVFIQMTNN